MSMQSPIFFMMYTIDLSSNTAGQSWWRNDMNIKFNKNSIWFKVTTKKSVNSTPEFQGKQSPHLTDSEQT